MPHGSIAGFDRPLAESELVFETAVMVTDDYGANLENSSFRAEQEERFEQMMQSSRAIRNADIQLNPAGNVVGVQIALGRDEVLGESGRGGVSVVDLKAGIEMAQREMNEITGFTYPTAYDTLGEPTDDVKWSIKAE